MRNLSIQFDDGSLRIIPQGQIVKANGGNITVHGLTDSNKPLEYVFAQNTITVIRFYKRLQQQTLDDIVEKLTEKENK